VALILSGNQGEYIMQIMFTKNSLQLGDGDVTALRLSQPVCLHVITGRVWVTMEGGGTDYWLAAGQRLEMPGPGLLVIESVKQASTLQFSSCRASWPVRMALAMRRLAGRGKSPADACLTSP
jgi:hypothetical protein